MFALSSFHLNSPIHCG